MGVRARGLPGPLAPLSLLLCQIVHTVQSAVAVDPRFEKDRGQVRPSLHAVLVASTVLIFWMNRAIPEGCM